MSALMSESLENFSMADGGLFPTVGLGTWKIPDAVLPDLIPAAVDLGYRHFDCACDYGNEKAVGEGLKKALTSGAQITQIPFTGGANMIGMMVGIPKF